MYYLLMIPESLDKSISTAIAVGSAALGLWAHRREIEKEKAESAKEQARIAHDAQQQYANRVKKEYAAERDFGHIKRDIDQVKQNIAVLNDEADERLDKLENKVERLIGAVETLSKMVSKGEP